MVGSNGKAGFSSRRMRGATGITLTPHQTLRLPRKMNVMIDRAHIWNVISNAQSSKSHPPTSPNTAPTTQNACHDWSWTSFTMRGATGITLTPHQTLRLPRKMNVMIDRAHIWNVISNAQSSKSHPPTSPNTAPTTQNACHDWSCSRMKRHLQCAEQQISPCNLTKYCACHAKLHSPKS